MLYFPCISKAYFLRLQHFSLELTFNFDLYISSVAITLHFPPLPVWFFTLGNPGAAISHQEAVEDLQGLLKVLLCGLGWAQAGL